MPNPSHPSIIDIRFDDELNRIIEVMNMNRIE